MRTAKKRKTELIHTIKQTWQSTNKGQNIQEQKDFEVILAIYGTLFYLEIFDSLKIDRQKEYFKKRYLSTYKNMSNLQLALEYGICTDTISNYSSKQIQIFEECLKLSKEFTAKGERRVNNNLISFVHFLVQNRKK